MATEANYDVYSGEGLTNFRKQQEIVAENKKNYENSEEFKTKIQEELNKLEQYLLKNSYKKLQPGVDKLEKGKIYYIIKRNPLGGDITPIKVTCIEVKPDGTGNFEGFDSTFATSNTKYKNISLDSYDGDKKNFFGIWSRSSGLNTVLGIGSASKYKAGKKLRKSRKSRKSKGKSRKTRKTKRR
jgi:hypothetical protein